MTDAKHDVALSVENVSKDYPAPAQMRTRRFFSRFGGLHIEDGFAPDALSGQIEDDDELGEDDVADEEEELLVRPEEVGARRVVDGVTLRARGGCVLGLVGPERAGKTVLLKLIGGIVAPSEGRIVVRGSVAPALNLLGPALPARGHTVRSALPQLGAMVGIAPHVVRRHLGEIADLMESPQLAASSTSLMDSKRKRDLVLAMALALRPDVLLLDIQIGHDAFGDRCVQRIDELRAGGTLVVAELRRVHKARVVPDRVVHIDQGRIVDPTTPDPPAVTSER